MKWNMNNFNNIQINEEKRRQRMERFGTNQQSISQMQEQQHYHNNNNNNN